VNGFITFSLLGVETELLSITAIPLLGVFGAALLHARACSILAGRGRVVPVSQRVSFMFGLGLILLATQTFIDPVGESSLLSLHMLQHLLIADLPAPFLLYGIRAPVIYFFWPKPVMVRVARIKPLRSLWAWLRRPPVALTVWLLTLYVWHLPFMYEAGLEHRLVHDLQHISFALTGMLAWWPLMDPTHHRVEGRVWKAVYVVAARMIGGILGVILVTWPTQIYTFYGDAALAYGMSTITDQRIAGGMMMMVDSVIVIVAATYFMVTIDRGAERVSDLDNPVVAAAIARAAEQEQERAEPDSLSPEPVDEPVG
jgi:cytochrome c oxidase assembly factor CtaG